MRDAAWREKSMSIKASDRHLGPTLVQHKPYPSSRPSSRHYRSSIPASTMRRSALLPLRAATRPIPTFRSRPDLTRSFVAASDLSFGQPLHETHPHLINAGERKRPTAHRVNNVLTSEKSHPVSQPSNITTAAPGSQRSYPEVASQSSPPMSSNSAPGPSSTSTIKTPTSSI